MKKSTKKTIGATVSVAAGGGYAFLIPMPSGFSPLYFHVLAPVAGYFGFEFGRWLSSLGYRPLMLVVIAIIAVPGLLYLYDLLRSGYPSTLNNVFIFFLYPSAVFAIGTALGVLELKLENLTGR